MGFHRLDIILVVIHRGDGKRVDHPRLSCEDDRVEFIERVLFLAKTVICFPLQGREGQPTLDSCRSLSSKERFVPEVLFSWVMKATFFRLHLGFHLESVISYAGVFWKVGLVAPLGGNRGGWGVFRRGWGFEAFSWGLIVFVPIDILSARVWFRVGLIDG
ncbi:MAG: hypothetical protein ISN28_12445 [Ectothiorhodospiraceae bacterium AqS1]|nr:hypothetical protein [Ectothiorhodospiraceae bacterium AqS1]